MNPYNTKPIFTNDFLLHIQDKFIRKQYFIKKYNFKKFLLYFFFNFCLILLNYILSTQNASSFLAEEITGLNGI